MLVLGLAAAVAFATELNGRYVEIDDEGAFFKSTESFGKVFARIADDSGIRRFHAHLLRHTWATNWMKPPGADLLALMRQGGWKRLQMVERYSHAISVKDRSALPNPMAEAKIGVEDRGFQFADGVYEVIRLYHGKPFTLREHLERLGRSAKALELPVPLDVTALSAEIGKLVAGSGVRDGMVYLQLTRGVAERNHRFPHQPRPTLLFYPRPLPPPQLPGEGEGVRLLAVPDERWKRCFIKSIALLPNVLAKNQAISAGADGYCVKSSDAATVIDAVRTVAAGGAYFDPTIARVVMARIASPRPASEAASPLTPRETGVLRLSANGRGNAEIAETLYMGLGTVKGHIRDILDKLAASDRTQAAVLALRRGYI